MYIPAKILTSASVLSMYLTVSKVCMYLTKLLSRLGLFVYDTKCVVKKSIFNCDPSLKGQWIRARPRPFCTKISPSKLQKLPRT